jgi:hypothetical protein
VLSVCSFRNGVDQLFLILFTKDEWIELESEEAYRLIRDHYPEELLPDDAEVTGFRATALALRDRLNVMGVDLAAVSSELERLVAERLALCTRMAELFPSGAEDVRYLMERAKSNSMR